MTRVWVRRTLVPVLIHVCGRYLLLSTLVECGAGQQVGSLRAMLKPSSSVSAGISVSAVLGRAFRVIDLHFSH